MSLLPKWLAKRGIKDPEDLTPEERVTYDRYRLILSGELVTVDKIKEFCRHQINVIEEKFASSLQSGDDARLKACLHVYLNLLKAIEAPEKERESLELHLNQIINN